MARRIGEKNVVCTELSGEFRLWNVTRNITTARVTGLRNETAAATPQGSSANLFSRLSNLFNLSNLFSRANMAEQAATPLIAQFVGPDKQASDSALAGIAERDTFGDL